ncbi:MAG TPA: sigma-54 dependent transcriptional regulator [Candidatus Binataceae bacterium]|nr:sigma-54 dependent transcriptional regulator [Candidatus Binataceae bacterium]
MRDDSANNDLRGVADWIEIAAFARPSLCAGIIGESSAIRAMFAAIERFAPFNGTVLITGESGSGKELVTRALHQLGPSPNGPLVSFNCANLVEGLAESQLFGHVKGAFTHAREAQMGCFRQAHGGTLMLDEVGELPLAMQAKLLRVADSFEVQPVGSPETIRVEVRILAATNRDLPTMVKAGTFRSDLYYRLNVASIYVPPLRERIDDVGPLTAHFVDKYNREFGRNVRFISRSAFALLRAHRWPGNIRELAHVIEHAALLGDDESIDRRDLPEDLLERIEDDPLSPLDGPAAAPDSRSRSPRIKPLDDVLKDTVERSLLESGGDCAEAARLLGISRPAIYRKMARFGITNASLRNYRRIARQLGSRVESGSFDPANALSDDADDSLPAPPLQQ